MSEPRTEYSNTLLSSLSPPQVVESVKRRMNAAAALNDDVADWIRERARIEHVYATELQRLAKRGLSGKGYTMGALDPVWTSVSQNLTDHAEARKGYARKLEEEVAKPLRNLMISSTPNRATQWQEFKSQHQALAHLASQLQHSEASFDKSRRKHHGRSSESAQVHLAEVRSQWENQAPYVVEQFEGLDDSRLVFLKDSLTRSETLHVDACQNGIKHSESALNKVLGFEPLEDMRHYLVNAKNDDFDIPQQAPSNGHDRAQRVMSTDSGLYDSPAPGARANTTPSLADDTSSVASKEKSGAKLRSKVGSIFRPRRGKHKEKEDNFPKPLNYNASQRTGGSGNGPAPQRSSTMPVDSQPTASPRSSTMPVDSKPPPSAQRTASMPLEPSQPPKPKPAPPPSRKANGPATEEHRDGLGPVAGAIGGAIGGVAMGAGAMAAMGDSSNKEESESGEPPLRFDIRQDTITEEGDEDAALSNVASQLRARPTVSGRAQRGRRDIQSRLFTNIEPTDIDSQQQQQPPQVPQQVSTQGGSPTSPTGVRPPSQQFLSQLQTFPSPQAGSSLNGESGTPESPKRPPVPGHHAETQSVISSRSSISSVPVGPSSTWRHPELPSKPGLVASVVEVVNAVVNDGNVTTASAMGEVAFGYNGQPESEAEAEGDEGTPAHIDIHVKDSEAVVDKMVPNQSFVQALDDGFRINGINSIVGSRAGVVGLKYSKKEHAATVPLIFTPIWRIEDGQSRLMLTYKLDPNVQKALVQELTVIVDVEGEGRAVSAQSKPSASFNRERQRVTWRISEPFELQTGVEKQLLCRLVTEGGLVKESTKGIEVRFRLALDDDAYLNQGVSFDYKVSNPFGDEDEWKTVYASRTCTSAKYLAHSEHNVN
uniref:ARAD1D36344p n=1 Tax=Blastobotrys adeninivorans TaxID=409370 RepID=A0A060TC19_BLAAD